MPMKNSVCSFLTALRSVRSVYSYASPSNGFQRHRKMLKQDSRITEKAGKHVLMS